jgi:hypothetical protein
MSEFPHTKTIIKFHINIRPQTLTVEVQPPCSPDLKPLRRFSSVRTLNTPRVSSSNLKWSDNSPTHFFVPVKPFATATGTFKRVQQYIIRRGSCMHWFRWRTFWSFVTNCKFTNNQISTAAKLGMCTVNVLSVESKILHSEGIYCWM